MGSFLETVYDVLFNPKQAMRYIAEKKLIGQALAMFSISMLVPVWAIYAGVKGTPGVSVLGLLFIGHVIGSLVLWVFSAAVLSFIAELAGGRGTAVGLFSALGFSQLPKIVITPLWVIAALLPIGVQATAFGLIGVITVIWMLALHVAALQGAFSLSGVRAVLVLSAPLLFSIGAIAAIIIFAGSALMQLPF